MNLDLAELKYLQILKICDSLTTKIGERTSFVYEALEQLCELYKNSCVRLPILRLEYISETDKALNSLREYAISVDNWKIEGCLFGIKDQCAILSLLLLKQEEDFEQLSGNFRTPQQIYKLLQEWKGLNITSRLSESS